MDDQQPIDDQSVNDEAQNVASVDDFDQLKAKCEEYLSGWKRAQADYANLLREKERDRSEYVKYANTSLLHALLPAIDQFGVAMRYIPDTSTLPEESRKTWENWLIGIKAVASLWEQAAQSIGLERIPASGTFDPNLHEAVGHEEKEGVETDTIIRGMQDGWKLHGKVLRAAQVIVAK